MKHTDASNRKAVAQTLRKIRHHTYWTAGTAIQRYLILFGAANSTGDSTSNKTLDQLYRITGIC